MQYRWIKDVEGKNEFEMRPETDEDRKRIGDLRARQHQILEMVNAPDYSETGRVQFVHTSVEVGKKNASKNIYDGKTKEDLETMIVEQGLKVPDNAKRSDLIDVLNNVETI